jgi:hypothetical protein
VLGRCVPARPRRHRHRQAAQSQRRAALVSGAGWPSGHALGRPATQVNRALLQISGTPFLRCRSRVSAPTHALPGGSACLPAPRGGWVANGSPGPWPTGAPRGGGISACRPWLSRRDSEGRVARAGLLSRARLGASRPAAPGSAGPTGRTGRCCRRSRSVPCCRSKSAAGPHLAAWPGLPSPPEHRQR